MPKIRKAVITAAGSGSRLLPFSKETPKEMLPYCARARDGRLILKPILEVVYESLHDHGYRKFCFVVGRGKRSIEDYFLIDDSAKYSTNSDLQDFYKKIRSSHIMYVQQSSPRGFGDAVLKAKLFAGKDSFLLHAGDDVILSPGNDHIQRLEAAFFSNGGGYCAFGRQGGETGTVRGHRGKGHRRWALQGRTLGGENQGGPRRIWQSLQHTSSSPRSFANWKGSSPTGTGRSSLPTR